MAENNKEILNTLADMNEAIGNKLDQAAEQTAEVRSDLNRFENSVKNQFAEVRSQLDRIENSILEDHARRIEAIERRIGINQ